MEIAGILLLAALAWLWLDSLRARDVALRTAREACASEGLMLLDYTVAIASLKLTRNENGRIQIQRADDFEYSDTGGPAARCFPSGGCRRCRCIRNRRRAGSGSARFHCA